MPTRITAMVILALVAVCASAFGQTTVHFDAVKKSVALSTGIEMKYVEAGSRNGEVVILLHGVTDTSRSFYPTIESLVDRGTALHVYALDQRGHGESSMPTEAECASAPERCFEMKDFAADVIAFMDALGIERASIVGHSMGSGVAQEIALIRPERVEGLVLIGAFVSGDNPVIHDFLLTATIEGDWKAKLERSRPGLAWPKDAYWLTPGDADPDVEKWMTENWVADPTADPALLREVLPETIATPLGTWLGALRGQGVMDNRERLTGLTVPVLVLWATQDSIFLEDPDQARLRAALDAAVSACNTRYYFKTYGKKPLPASGLQENDLGHNTQWGAPEAVAADIESFFTTGKPTRDLPYADAEDVRAVRTAVGEAKILAREPGEQCRTQSASARR
ncbi:MAG TPA: alpha/beta hydrolase [Vicinamibacteria bacterium]|nr:alpha/beta hydrolase [Vicinamibacteria bacterium]